MESNVIKCSGCNLVISEVLAFVKNKLDVMNEDSLSRICETAFTPEEIVCAKKLLYDSVLTDKRIKIRKGDKKAHRDIEDIISLLKRADSDTVPIFVARDLQKLPPITFDHVDVTRLLKDILVLKEDLKSTQERFITVDTFQMLKKDVDDLKFSSIPYRDEYENVNTQRGNYLRTRMNGFDSRPIGLKHITGFSPNNSGSSLNGPDDHNKQEINSYRPIGNMSLSHNNQQNGVNNSVVTSIPRMLNQRSSAAAKSEPVVHTKARMSCDNSARVKSTTTCLNQSNSRMCEQEIQTSVANANSTMLHTDASQSDMRICAEKTQLSIADKLKELGKWKLDKPSEEWTLVQLKRLKNKIVGKMGSAATELSGNFKAADINIPLFIYNVNKSTTESDITTHVHNKTQINVSLKKIDLKIDRGYNAYKLLVPKTKLNMFLNEKFWPEGVLFRRFVNFSKTKMTNEDNHDQRNG